MEVEQIFDEELHLAERPLLPRPSMPINSTPIRVFLVLMSLLALAIISTAAAEIDVMYLLICYHEKVGRNVCFQSPEVGPIASQITLYASVVQALGGIFVVPTLTSLSDRIGRKPIFIFTTCVTLISQSLKWWLVFGTTGTPHYMWILVPLIVATCGGGIGIFTPLAVSYISDTVLDSVERARYISFVDASLFVAIAAGPTLGSTIISSFGLQNLYFASIGTLAITILLSTLFMSESLSKVQKRQNQESGKVGMVQSCKMLAYKHIEDPKRRRTARLFTVCSVLGTEFMMAIINVMFLYVKNQFNWTAVQTGYFITTTSSHRFVGYLVGFPFLYKTFSSWWPTHPGDVDRVDMTFLRLALGFCTGGFLLMSVSTRPKTFIVSALIESTASYANPIYRSALVKYAPEGQFGTFMGSISLVTSIMALVLPGSLLKIYGKTMAVWPGLAFLLVSGAFALLFMSSFMVKAKR